MLSLCHTKTKKDAKLSERTFVFPPFAALANGNTIHADDFDDTLAADPSAHGYHGSTHPTGPLLSTLLASIDSKKFPEKIS